ncbi:PQQ-dependent sugar dehydrogenase [uncultured Flavobacterium sp.]|uniref:PQQ-dependent sugar dehydrogenase n=1 Tax=uncultured Flavobacterium sp. TaxID=165435 RepID=UPI0026014B46|nr:PQQ-dependent sugar dehydrogenase [uncultured Flavobacterium sp.]
MKTTLQLLMLFACNVMLSQTVAIQSFATGLTSPVEIVNAGDTRLFVVEQGGRIKIVNANGTVNTTPFLNIASLITSGGEQGLLGLAFHPDYPGNGYFYVNYTNTAGNTVIARYTVSSDANVANASSAQILMTIPQPASNHNGGTLRFGPDGYLYIGMGDGGGAGDTGNRAQNINELLGKMLRIDVNTGSPYGIPAGNPYAGATPGADEIWAIGLRNPWKFSFDQNGFLWIADVGQNQIEEINKQPSTSAGLNYGWRCYEGNSPYNTAGCGAMNTMIFPISQYTHSDGCSITGGYFYAGSAYPNFIGNYFFADYCRNRIGRINSSGTITYSATFTGSNNFTTFGQNLTGELFIASSSGNIYKVIDSSLSTNDFAVNGFKMYPNPAGERVEISSTNNLTLSQFSVVDLSGKILLQQPLESTNQHVIDVSSLQTGLYIVKLQDVSGKIFTSKLDIK